MKPGQVLTGWWQRLVGGGFRSPQDLYRAARLENPDAALASDRFFSIPDDQLSWDAPARLQAPSMFTAEPYLRQSQRCDWQHVDPRLMQWAALFVEYARKWQIPLYVHCAYRGELEQSRVNREGHSRASYPRSPHNIGEAVDIVHSVFHWDLSRAEWALLHILGLRALDRINATLKKDQKLELVWGGSFKSLYDPAHWEIRDFRDRRRPLVDGPPVRFTPRAILRRL